MGEDVRITQSALSVRNLVFASPSVSLICCYNKAANPLTKWFKITLSSCSFWALGSAPRFWFGLRSAPCTFPSSRASGPPRARAMVMAEAQKPSQAALHMKVSSCVTFANIPPAKASHVARPNLCGPGKLLCPLQWAQRTVNIY